MRGDPSGAAAGLERAIRLAPPGSEGWLLPLDPLLRMTDGPAWTNALALLRARAA